MIQKRLKSLKLVILWPDRYHLMTKGGTAPFPRIAPNHARFRENKKRNNSTLNLHHKIDEPYLVINRSLYFGEQAVEHLGRHPKGDKETLRVGIIEFIPDE